MKVLFYSYPWAFQKKGGGEIQLLKTGEYLKKAGVEIKLFDFFKDKLEENDILHIFGSLKDNSGFLEAAKKSGIKICVSSIFWTDIRRYMGEIGIKNRINALAHHLIKATMPFLSSGRKKIFSLADLILPNSESEARQIERYFNIGRDKFFVVPNGVEERFKYAKKDEFVKKYGIEGFILYAGRIEPRKNQLNFIKAMRGFKKSRVVFVGDHTLEHKEYYEACLKEKDDNMIFLGPIDHESSLLASLYGAAGVFCLTSWFETPGLAALEAAVAGKNIVITPYGSTKDYFGDLALYAYPQMPNDIRAKVEEAFCRSSDNRLQQKVLDNYSWYRVAEKTMEAYRKVLS